MPRLLVVVLFSTLTVVATAETADLAVVHQIKTEAFENSEVMDHLFYLTDVNGPRVTNSPGFRSAGEWTVKQLKGYGLKNVKLESWGPFGRGWSYSRFAAHMLEPGYTPLIGFPLAWSPGTDGVITAEPIFAVIKEKEDFEKHKGKLEGKIVLVDEPRTIKPATQPLARRYSEDDLADRAMAPNPKPKEKPEGPTREERRKFADDRNRFLREEGAVAVFHTSYKGQHGLVAGARAGRQEKDKPVPPPTVALSAEHYNRIVRLLKKEVPVKIELEIEAQFHEQTLDSFNVIAEIPGGAKKDEVVMLGGHLDSWHGGTGATDNGAGVAVVIEAARILTKLDLKLGRTVRLALWGGEEQGLLGSKAYVKERFADPETMKPTAAHAKLAAYFNYDNGGGKIRGIYLQSNDMVRPIFSTWLEPFHDLGASTISIRNTGGTDHLSFDAVGLPGFQFIQDPMDYSSQTHHSNMDVYDHIVPGDLMQASAIMASFAYHAANRAEPLPRKPLPKPKPKEEESDQ